MFNRKCFCNCPMCGMENMPMPQTYGGMENAPQTWGDMDDNMPEMGCPVVEPTITKCVQRDFCHQVPHL